jgi:hypothetical protein
VTSLASHPELKAELSTQVDLDNNVNFVSNDRLRAFLETTDATPEQIEQSVQINADSRLRALKIGLLIMSLLSLLAIFPASRLPNHKPGEIPSNPPLPKPVREED